VPSFLFLFEDWFPPTLDERGDLWLIGLFLSREQDDSFLARQGNWPPRIAESLVVR